MEPGESSGDDAAELLSTAGLAPVYRFDFSKYGFFTYRWDGESWKDDRDAGVVLGEFGIELPGWNPLPSSPRSEVVRRATVVEGFDVDRARALVAERAFESDRVLAARSFTQRHFRMYWRSPTSGSAPPA